MKLVMTMMVRDEADIIDAVIRFSLDQGVDLLIITDNGSVDGTLERLEEYVRTGRVVLHHEPRQLKEQYKVVTRMAREAFTEHGADWVINADADEFWLPVDRSLTLRDALSAVPTSVRAFPVPVVNLIGPIARSGAGLDRLVWRDGRSVEQLHDVGLLAHPTPNVVHVGDPDVEVAQGNHFVSIEQDGDVDPRYALEVLHLPWRSWRQFEHKTEITGRAYASNPDLAPSPNHHGMKEYRRYLEGRLLPAYVLRFPTREELESGAETGAFRREETLARYLRAQGDGLRSLLTPDEPLPEDEETRARAAGRSFLEMERAFEARIAVVQGAHDQAVAERDAARDEVAGLRGEVLGLRDEVGRLQGDVGRLGGELAVARGALEQARSQLDRIRSLPVVRAAIAVRNRARSIARSAHR
jgi:glycosyltransferase involved in cell wall biosynthesis